MVTAGVPTNSAEYLGAQAYFAPDGSPTVIAIGRKDPTKVVLTPTPVDGATYTVYVGDDVTPAVAATYVAGNGEAASIIAAGIEAAVSVLSVASIATAVVGDTVEITQVASTTAIVNKWTSNIAATYQDSESFADAFTAVSNENDSWYGLSTYSHSQSDIEAIAAYAQGVKKLYGYSTGNTDDITAVTTNIGGSLQSSAYTRSLGVHNIPAGTDADPVDATVVYPECTLFGDRLTSAPGSSTWKFKPLVGITPDGLTTTQANFALAKNLNTYETIGGQNIAREGTVASGEFIDIIRGVDWLESRIEERIYFRLVNLDKIPYTQAGINVIVTEVRAQLKEAQDVGLVANDSVDSNGSLVSGFTITVPNIADISATDKAARTLPGISFIAKLAGAVHTVAIEGTVTV